MATRNHHPVDQLSDTELRDLMLRVDTTDFPDDPDRLWQVERVRYRETLRRIPPARSDRAILLDLGSSRPWLPFFQEVLGYQRIVLNTSYPESGFVDEQLRVAGAEPADVCMSVFDVEREPFPHPDETFDVVLCLEVVEHLAIDPMAVVAEVNRVLKPDGTFVLSTPNALRYANIVNMMLGEQPLGYVGYNGWDTNRHNRIYTPDEIAQMFRAAGMSPDEVTTFGTKKRGFRRAALRRVAAAMMFPFRRCPGAWRRDVILACGKKTSTRIERRPSWLYFDLTEQAHSREKQHEQALKNPPAATRPPVPTGV